MNIKLLLILIIFSSPLFAQWELIKSDIKESLRKSYPLNEDEWFISTDKDYFLKTEDGFLTFRKIHTGITGEAKQYKFINDSIGYVLKKSHLLKTTDRGESWSIVFTNPPNDLYNMSFINEDTGWVSSESGIYFTSNGAADWEAVYNVSTERISFINSLKGFAIINEGLFKTSDGGSSWEQVDLQSQSYYEVTFQNENDGLVFSKELNLNRARLFITSDGGDTWSLTPISPNVYYKPKDFSFIDSSIIIAFSFGSGIRSDDNGNTWEYYPIWGTNNNSYYLGKDAYVSFSIYGISAGKIAKSTNRGKTWEHFGSRYGGDKILFVDSLTGFASPWLITNDGGNTWERNPFEAPRDRINDYHFFTTKRGIVAAYQYLFSTSDGGETWNEIMYMPDDNFRQIFFTDSLNGWVLIRRATGVGVTGTIRTTDGGYTWSDFDWFTVDEFEDRKIFFVTDKIGFVYNDDHSYGTDGHRSTDGGITWHLNTFAQVRFMSFINESTGIGKWDVPGVKNKYIKTTDAGSTFAEIPSESIGGTGLFFLNDLVGWRMNSSRFEITYDGGGTWEIEDETQEFSRDIGWNLHGNSLFAGAEGFLFRRNLFTLNADESVKPSEYSLKQNYPNPFNPTTVIRFSLSLEELTTIKVYDILGREIKTLVDKVMVPGEHEIIFDASDFSAGIYFYHLRAGDFIETKKMTFIK